MSLFLALSQTAVLFLQHVNVHGHPLSVGSWGPSRLWFWAGCISSRTHFRYVICWRTPVFFSCNNVINDNINTRLLKLGLSKSLSKEPQNNPNILCHIFYKIHTQRFVSAWWYLGSKDPWETCDVVHDIIFIQLILITEDVHVALLGGPLSCSHCCTERCDVVCVFFS